MNDNSPRGNSGANKGNDTRKNGRGNGQTQHNRSSRAPSGKRKAVTFVRLAIVVMMAFGTMGSRLLQRHDSARPKSQTTFTRSVNPPVVSPAGDANDSVSNNVDSPSVDSGAVGSVVYPEIAFRSKSFQHSHFLKHGSEFGSISEDQYVHLAQVLRDSPISSSILQANQLGGTISRFDRASGAFTAFDKDLTIRTFFKPNGGEQYFRRAAKKSH